jgi:hypothetical protein
MFFLHNPQPGRDFHRPTNQTNEETEMKTATKAVLKMWTNPATGEVRAYVNSPSLQMGQKIYFVQSGADGTSMKWFGNNSSVFNLVCDRVCQQLEESGINLSSWKSIESAAQ